MIVKRVFQADDPILWSIAQAEKKGNPIHIGDTWLFFKAFHPRGREVVVEFEKVGKEAPVTPDEAEQRLMDALRDL